MRRPARFSKSDIDRAVSAVKAAGCVVAGVDIWPDGRIRVITTAAGSLTEETEDERLDREIREDRARHGHGSA